jgi:hypothetical protein
LKIDISISDLSKEQQAKIHNGQINQWIAASSNGSIIDDKIISYSDGSQSDRGYNGAGHFLTNSSFSNQESMAWNLGRECEVYEIMMLGADIYQNTIECLAIE